MSTFQVAVGACLICSEPASLGVGSMACESCGYDRICGRCAATPCPERQGHLEATERVFPHSLFRAILKGDEHEIERLFRKSPGPLDDLKNREGETALALAVGTL
jgi:hypothetical protein